MAMINKYDAQLAIEYKYSRKQIREYILKDIQGCPELMAMVAHSVGEITRWLMADHGYAAKNARLLRLQLRLPNLEDLVLDLLSITLLAEEPQKLTQVAGQCAGFVPLSDKREQVQTAAEVLGLLFQQGYFALSRNPNQELLLQTHFVLDERIIALINQAKYLPPMLCPPRKLVKNYQSGYLTFDDSLILKQNHHNDDICLDSLNTFNSVPLSLKVEMLTTISEPLPAAINTVEKKQAWLKMVTDSYDVYADLVAAGNEFYITHKVDKRGRTYAQGYHVSYQGNKFRQAIIELAEKRFITK